MAKLKRDFSPKPRKQNTLPFEKLEEILGKIYPPDVVGEILKKRGFDTSEKEKDE